jgi:hypothetical protein
MDPNEPENEFQKDELFDIDPAELFDPEEFCIRRRAEPLRATETKPEP